MKQLSIFILSTILLLCGCSSDSSDTSDSAVTELDTSSDDSVAKQEIYASTETTEEQLLAESSTENNFDVGTNSTTTSAASANYSDLSSGPDEIELMSYAQTVLDDYFPDCKYSRNTSDYNFVKTNLKYKIEGKVTVNSNYSEDNFYMIINFVDESYGSYDLISLQVGDEMVYESSSTNSGIPVKDSAENEILNAENTKIYNEVMEALYADYERDEDSILEELAPNYNMTSSELKEFLRAYMEAYYSN